MHEVDPARLSPRNAKDDVRTTLSEPIGKDRVAPRTHRLGRVTVGGGVGAVVALLLFLAIIPWLPDLTTRARNNLLGTPYAKQQPVCRMIGMTSFEDRQPPAIGLYWINEGDYRALVNIFDDGKKMPSTWKEWLKIAEEMERGLKAYGHVVMRVHIDPNTFPDWCAAHGTSTGGEGRKRFIRAAVTERYGNQD